MVGDPFWWRKAFSCGLCLLLATWMLSSTGFATRAQSVLDAESLSEPDPPAGIRVEPQASDDAIEARLQRVLDASEWFQGATVEVSEGIVFLQGTTDREERREWAGRVAGATQDVVAVVNRIEVAPTAIGSFEPAWAEVRGLVDRAQRLIPPLILSLAVLAITWFAARGIARAARWALATRVESRLLLTWLSRAITFPVFVVGLYLVLQIAGLTRLALTVLGGTGLFGLVIGFAFRDIAENFLASILLSVRNPFRMDDLVRIGEHEGIVRNLNTRSTVLFTLDGNHVQIPNATVYKSVITNYSTSATRRTEFVVGIGYEDSVPDAQGIISAILAVHPAVLNDPKPLVLVDQLATSTVNLKIYAWFDSKTYSPIKLRSALMEQIKQALLEHGISMPDEAREIIFPRGLPIYRMPPPDEVQPKIDDSERTRAKATQSEAGVEDLANEDIVCEEDASHVPEGNENLLKPKRG